MEFDFQKTTDSNFSTAANSDLPVGHLRELPVTRLNILIVDDDEVSGGMLKNFLRSMNHEVLLIQNSETTVEVIQSIDFDMVFMDCMMPGLNGYQCTRMLRERGFTKPIIGISGTISPQYKDQCRQSGMNDFISKPVDLLTLQKAIPAWITMTLPSRLRPIKTTDGPPVEAQESLIQHLDLLTDATSRDATEEMIKLFLKNTPTKISQTLNAFNRNDFPAMEQIAHQLKSTCGYLGLKSLQEIAETIEQAAIKEDKNQLDQLKRDLEIQYAEYSAFLIRYIIPKRREGAYAPRLSH